MHADIDLQTRRTRRILFSKKKKTKINVQKNVSMYVYVCVISKVGVIINKSYNGYTRAHDFIRLTYYIPSHKNRYSAAAVELPIQS